MATEKTQHAKERLDKKSGKSVIANTFKCLIEAGFAFLRVLMSHYQ